MSNIDLVDANIQNATGVTIDFDDKMTFSLFINKISSLIQLRRKIDTVSLFFILANIENSKEDIKKMFGMNGNWKRKNLG